MMKLCSPKLGILKKQINSPNFENLQEKYKLKTDYKSASIKFSFIPKLSPIQMVKHGDVEKGMK